MTSLSLTTTPEIIAAFRAQNWAALEGLVKQYTEMLLKGALSLGFRNQQADDLVQSVWAAFCYREVEDLEMPEICKILDVTNTHLGVLLYRAKNRLRECIERKVDRK